MDALPLGSDRVAHAHAWIGALATTGVLSFASVAAAANINGQVLGAGAPIAGSMVTLFAASAGAPKQLGHVRTGTDGRFVLNAPSAVGNDTMAAATVSGAAAAQLKAHASAHADGTVSVMVTNTSRTGAAKVTVNVTGAGTALACVGARYIYAPVNGDQDGELAYAPIFATTDGTSVPVAVPPLSTVVVVFPKK